MHIRMAKNINQESGIPEIMIYGLVHFLITVTHGIIILYPNI